MQLATSTKRGAPWVCNVWYVSDSKQNLYWISPTDKRHSQELAKNNHAAATITLAKAPGDKRPWALQIEGTVEQISGLSKAHVTKNYVSKGLATQENIKKLLTNITSPRAIYKLTPSKIILFDPSNIGGEPLHEYTP